jgi:hypothetical protein
VYETILGKKEDTPIFATFHAESTPVAEFFIIGEKFVVPLVITKQLVIQNIYFNNSGSSREMWLSPVIQATGRQEQWDGLPLEVENLHICSRMIIHLVV